jgi:hypothetical protein
VGLSRVVSPREVSAEWLDFVLGEDLGQTVADEAVPYFLSERLHFLLPPGDEGEGAAFVLPSPFDTGAIAAVVEVRPLPVGDEDPGTRKLVEEELGRVREAVVGRAKRAAERATPLAAPELIRVGLDTVQPAIEEPPGSRKAVIYLARLTGAAVAEGLGTVVSDTVLSEYEESLTETKAELSEVRTAAEVGWWMERQAIRTALDAIVRGESEQELTSVLVLRAGQVGMSPSVLQEVVDASEGLADFAERLVHENVIFLEDSEASARVRAFDWLAAQNRAPAGYDPLGPRKERREALLGTLPGKEADR